MKCSEGGRGGGKMCKWSRGGKKNMKLLQGESRRVKLSWAPVGGKVDNMTWRLFPRSLILFVAKVVMLGCSNC